MQATTVFEKNWEAINAKLPNGKRKYRYIINTGSSRSSKTHSILQTHYLTAFLEPNTRISIWRDTKKDTKDTVLSDFKKALPNFENNELVNFHKTESIYTFPNKSTIEINGSDDDTKVHGFQGDVLHFNEPYKMSKAIFDQLDMRNSEYVIIDWNPKAKHWIDELSRQENAIVIHSTFLDNPFCPEQQKIKILSYDPSNELNVKNNTADEYMWSVYGLGMAAEKPNKVFRNWQKISWEEFLIIDSPIYYGLDWGTVHPMGIVEIKYYDGTFYINELSYKSENDLVTELIKEYGIDYQKYLKGQGLGVITWHLKRLGINKKNVIICDSAKPDKIRELINAGYNALPAHKPSGSVFSGISFMQRANVCYTDNSYNLGQEYMSYEWNTDRYGMITEEPIKRDDDLLDPSRYVISYLAIVLRIVI